jgi:ketosteroid isomerase-like protein
MILQGMRKKANTIAVLFCWVSVLGSARIAAQSDTSPPTAETGKLIALENAWNQAQLHHDAQALQTLISDNFVNTDYDGTVMNKAQFLLDLKDPAYHATLITNENVKVFSYQNVAIVIGAYHTKGTYKGQPFDHHGRFTDTWVYQNYTWQCVASHTNLNKK